MDTTLRMNKVARKALRVPYLNKWSVIVRKGLFRRQAIGFQQTGIQGPVLMAPKPIYTLVTAFLVIWLIATCVFLVTANYARKATVLGWLEPDKGVLRVYSPNKRGNVIKVHVSPGSLVKKGDPLISLDFGTPVNGSESLEQALKATLIKAQLRINETVARTLVLQQQELAHIEQQLLAAREDLASFHTVLQISHSQLVIAQNAFNTIKGLHTSGNTTQTEVNQTQLRVLSSQQKLQETERNIANKELEITHLVQQQHTLPINHENQKAALHSQLSDIEKQLIRLEGEHQLTLYASTDAIVAAIQAKTGQIAEPALPLMTLVPKEYTIEANMMVPVSAAGFLSNGQEVALRYDAFPYQKFGLHTGSISHISHAVILPGELNQAPIQINEPAYLVKAKLNQETVLAFGNEVALKSGMTFSADVSLDERTLVEWLFEPLLSLSGRI